MKYITNKVSIWSRDKSNRQIDLKHADAQRKNRRCAVGIKGSLKRNVGNNNSTEC